MSQDVEPLDRDVASVLQSARDLDVMAPEAEAQVLEQVTARIAGLPPGGGAPDGAASAPVRPSIAHWGHARVLFVAGASFALGVATGAAVRRPPAAVERIVYVDRAPAATLTATTASGSHAVAVASAPAPPAPVSAATNMHDPSAGARSSASPASSRDRLAAESALLDIARVAVADGDAARALDAIGRHRAEFPNGVLAEERDALAVKALHQAGRDAEARARLTRFEAAYPESLFLPALRSVLEGRP